MHGGDLRPQPGRRATRAALPLQLPPAQRTSSISFLNSVVLEGLTGQSLGKRLMKLTVVREEAEQPPGILGALARWLALLLDGAVGWIPALVSMLASRRRHRIGDRIAKTAVVSLSSLQDRTYADLRTGEPVSPGLMMDLLGPDGEDPRRLRDGDPAAGRDPVAGFPGHLGWHDGESWTAHRRPAVVTDDDAPRLAQLRSMR